MQSSRVFDVLCAAARLACITTVGYIAGCVAIPIPTALPDAKPFTPETLAPIRVGYTTRDEVRSLFAAWSYTTDDGPQTAHVEPQVSDEGRFWIFGLPRQTGDFAFAGIWLLPEVPFPVPFFTDKKDNYENNWVLIEFADDATVAASWIVSDTTPCASDGVCYRGGYLQLIADEGANEDAHSRTSVADRCVLYTYAQDDLGVPVTVTNGVHPLQLFAKTSFVRTEMPPGPQTVSAWVDTVPAWIAVVPVTCKAGSTHYVAVKRQLGLLEATEKDPSEGKRAIAKRFLVDRLVAAQPSVATVRHEDVWTNCTSADPCHQLAVLDQDGFDVVPGVVGEDGRVKFMGIPRRLLLHPGRYMMRSPARERHDTFDLESGHRYRLVNKQRHFDAATS